MFHGFYTIFTPVFGHVQVDCENNSTTFIFSVFLYLLWLFSPVSFSVISLIFTCIDDFFYLISLNSLFLQSFFISFSFLVLLKDLITILSVWVKASYCRTTVSSPTSELGKYLFPDNLVFYLIGYRDQLVLLCSPFTVNAWKISIWFCAQQK